MQSLERKNNLPPPTLRQHLEGPAFREAVRQALPKHLPPDRFIRVALTALTRTPALAQCDQASFFQCLLSLSQLGLEPDGRRAHLIPYQNRKRGVTECQLIIDYKGLVELVMRSGAVSYIHADVVCDNDVFEVDRGELKAHRINFRENRGKVYAVYALCRFKDGMEKSEVMTRDEVESIRNRSRAANAGPWVTDWSEMAKKTVFRRLSKWLPLSPEFRDAVDADDEITSGKTAPDSARPLTSVFETLTSAPSLPEQAPDPNDPDEAALAEAGLAPSQSKPVETPAAKESQNAASPSPQIQLGQLITSKGYTFDTFKQWAVNEGLFTHKSKPDDVNSFEEMETSVAKQLLRAEKGMLSGIEQMLTQAK